MTESAVHINSLEILMKYAPLTLHQPLSREEFVALADTFPELQMERSKSGQVTIMAPVKKGSGKFEAYLITMVGAWALERGLGEVFSSSTGVELPDGAVRSPDCAWVSDERLSLLAPEADDNFLQAVPDFVAEIRSATDRISMLKKKMKEVWMANGVRLAWLIDPYEERVWIYREGKEPEKLEGFSGRMLAGEAVMPGLELPLDKLKR
jgi:Uma2 family endonuclease